MSHTPTPEQAAIISFVRDRTENLLVDALAGAAKTSTLVMACEATNTPTLSIAFNKRIADELRERMPAHVECKTLNSIGHRVWGSFLRKRLTLQKSKRADLLRAEINALSGEDVGKAWDAWADLIRAVEYAAQCGYVPDKTFPQAKRLMGDDELLEMLEFEPSDLEFGLIRRVCSKAISDGLKGLIDFSDQLLLPAIFSCSFESYPLIMIDEAQDLSKLNHVLLRKIVGPRGRLIAVGDPCQSIYGFRGAHQDSMDLLRTTFNMEYLPLTISFRCPTAVVEHVRWRAPAMRWPEWAKPGTIDILQTWNADSIPDGAAIICRNNAPLFRTALRLLKEGRRPQLAGNDIIRGIMKDLKKFGAPDLPQADVFAQIKLLETSLRARYRDAAFVGDKIACLELFAEAGPNLGQAMARAEQIQHMTGSISLMTGHKSKGLEFERVFFLDEQLVRSDKDQQEANLRYVICTRAKEHLTYITTDGWPVEGEEEE